MPQGHSADLVTNTAPSKRAQDVVAAQRKRIKQLTANRIREAKEAKEAKAAAKKDKTVLKTSYQAKEEKKHSNKLRPKRDAVGANHLVGTALKEHMTEHADEEEHAREHVDEEERVREHGDGEGHARRHAKTRSRSGSESENKTEEERDQPTKEHTREHQEVVDGMCRSIF